MFSLLLFIIFVFFIIALIFKLIWLLFVPLCILFLLYWLYRRFMYTDEPQYRTYQDNDTYTNSQSHQDDNVIDVEYKEESEE